MTEKTLEEDGEVVVGTRHLMEEKMRSASPSNKAAPAAPAHAMRHVMAEQLGVAEKPPEDPDEEQEEQPQPDDDVDDKPAARGKRR